jgi:hypothetical protein
MSVELRQSAEFEGGTEDAVSICVAEIGFLNSCENTSKRRSGASRLRKAWGSNLMKQG